MVWQCHNRARCACQGDYLLKRVSYTSPSPASQHVKHYASSKEKSKEQWPLIKPNSIEIKSSSPNSSSLNSSSPEAPGHHSYPWLVFSVHRLQSHASRHTMQPKCPIFQPYICQSRSTQAFCTTRKCKTQAHETSSRTPGSLR
jgi:hypothetical protein